MSSEELYNVYSNQQTDDISLNDEHGDSPEHFDYPHQDYYTDEI